MESNEFLNAVNANDRYNCRQHNFIVKFKNSNKPVKKRYFIVFGDNEQTEPLYVCEFRKNSRTRGMAVSNDDITNIESVVAFNGSLKSKEEVFANNCEKVITYLTKSGFWSDILADLIIIKNNVGYANFMHEYEDAEREEENFHKELMEKMENGTSKGMVYENGKAVFDYTPSYDINALRHLTAKYGLKNTYDEFDSLFSPKAIRTIKYPKYDKEFASVITDAYQKYAKEGKLYRTTYNNGYVITLTYGNANDNTKKAWYSEEFKNCGNGYYYLLLDDKHI